MNFKSTNLSALIPFMLAMAGAYAAPPTADLKVNGKLVVPVCTVSATDDGVYNIGKVSATTVKPSGNTVLASMTKTWTITCDAQTYLNFSHTDNRADSASTVDNPYFGLGNVNGNGKIGFYTVDLSNASVDGKTTNLFHSKNGTSTITSNNVGATRRLHDGWRMGWAATATTQKSGLIFAADMIVTPTLASSTVMNGAITDDANIDGSLTLNFAYGI